MYFRPSTETVYQNHSEIRAALSEASLPTSLSDTLLAEFGIYAVEQTAPEYDRTTHAAIEMLPVNVDGKWYQHWSVRPLTQEEIIANRKALVPAQVTMRQATQALILAGLDDDVETMLAGMQGVAGKLARAEWAKSQVVERDRPLVTQMAAGLGLDSAALDQLFITAATL